MSEGRELLVGAVIIVAIAVAVVGTLWLQGSNFGRPVIRVESLSESAGQLSEGNAVVYRGVRVGQVSSISVEEGGSAVRIVVLLSQSLPLPDDAGMVLGPESLFGDWQAEIVSRSSLAGFSFYDLPEGAAPVAPDARLIGGYALPELSRLTASAEQISGNLAELSDRLELTFNQETADHLSTAIANIEAITQEVRTLVQQQGQVASNITRSADSALAEIEIAARTARRSFERIDGMLQEGQVDTILTNLKYASESARRVTEHLADTEDGIGATLDRADSAFARVDRITARLEAGEGSIGRLLVDSTLAIRAEDVLVQLDLLLRDVRENPRRYVRLSIF